jgi:hypothetical protein
MKAGHLLAVEGCISRRKQMLRRRERVAQSKGWYMRQGTLPARIH